jgi:hypothetical protein
MSNPNLHIIGIAGKKHSGKDTIHKIIHNACRHSFVVEHKPFAEPLKREVAEAAGISLEYLEENKENFRLILQGWGTDFRRRLVAEDYWIVKWKAAIHYLKEHSMHPIIIVVPDVRFLNEANAIKEEGGKLWSCAMVNGPTRTDDTHDSETQLDYYQDFDWLVKNEFGKPQELITKVKEQLQRMKLT